MFLWLSTDFFFKMIFLLVLRNNFNFWNVLGFMNTLGLLQNK